MQKTTNYGFNKPESNDFYNIDDFNENMDVIDAKLKEVEEASGKSEELTEHIANKKNPHEVTAAQIGALTMDDVRMRYVTKTDMVQIKDDAGNWHDKERGGLAFQYLIKNGEINTEFCGDLIYEGNTYSRLSNVTAIERTIEAAEITKNGNELLIFASKAASNGVWGIPYSLGKVVDLTEYKYLKATFKISTNYTGTAEHQSSLVIRNASFNGISPYTPIAHYALLDFTTMGTSNTGTAVIDVSALSGAYDIVLDLAFRPTSNTTTLTFEVTDMWLE